MTDFNSVTTSQGTTINLDLSSQAAVNELITSFRDSHNAVTGADRSEMSSLRVSQRVHLYTNLGAFVGIAIQLLDPANETFLKTALANHGLTPAREGDNPHRPIADMLFGEWKDVYYKDKEGKVQKRTVPKKAARRKLNGMEQYFVPNRSAEKYAKVARYAVSQGWDAADVAEKMLSFKGKMDGILQADTAATRKTDTSEVETDTLVELVYSSEPHIRLDISQCGLTSAETERELIGLWAEIDDGEVLIRGVLPTSDDAIRSFVRKYAKDNSEKLWQAEAQRLKKAKATE